MDLIAPAIDNDTFQLWIKRDYIDIQDKKPGRGRIRYLSFCECIAISAFAFLLRGGERPKFAKRMAQIVADRARSIVESKAWDLRFLETEPGFEYLITKIDTYSDNDDEASLRFKFCREDKIGAEISTSGYVCRVIEADHLIWRTWEQIDQNLISARVPWRQGYIEPEHKKLGYQSGFDENGNPTDPNHPWNRK